MGKNLPGIKKVCTVWLEAENEGYEDKLKMFFCFNCRIPIIEYTGKVMQLVPGGSPYTPSTVLKCKGSVQRRDGSWEDCGMFYSFIDSVRSENPKIT